MTVEQRDQRSEVIWVDPERMSGAPCFKGTRVPVRNLLDYIEGDSTMDEFFEDYPSVPRGTGHSVPGTGQTATDRVRVFLDQCVPARLNRAFPGHAVQTVTQAGWRTSKDGPLLQFAQIRFDVFVTVDRKIEHQFDLEALDLAFVIAQVPNNRLDGFKSIFEELNAAVPAARAGNAKRPELLSERRALLAYGMPTGLRSVPCSTPPFRHSTPAAGCRREDPPEPGSPSASNPRSPARRSSRSPEHPLRRSSLSLPPC